MDEKREILHDVRNLLEYAKSLRVTEVQIKPSLVARRSSLAARRSSLAARRSSLGKKDASACNAHGTTDTMKSEELGKIRAEIGDCMRCKLCKGRKNIVFGVGNPNARLMFIGEGPGADEDMQGIPFVGRAGQLLTKIIAAMGFKREEVYIANIVKCKPPGNRNPEPDEVATCIPFLIRQARAIGPEVIVCLGSVATQNLLGTEEKITRIRGKFTEWQGTPVMPTYHPAFLLRNPNMKKPVWEDMQKVMKLLAGQK